MFDYLDYKNKIPLHKCVLEHPKLNPLSAGYRKYWLDTVRRKQIEGHWVEHNKEWKWIPGSIIQYTSLWTIEMDDKDSKSQTKILGRPNLRDIEWIKGYVHAWARGFSGFMSDDKYSCHRILLDPELEERLPYLKKHVKESIFNSKGQLKEYKEALPYLYEYYDSNLGKPIFYNEAKNVSDIECRNIGKTMITGNFCGHNFLTDGAMDYDEIQELRAAGKKQASQTMIGAIDTKYSKGLISKLKVGLDNLPGKIKIGTKTYPAPLKKKYSGSWKSGEAIEAFYKKKVGGAWEIKGSGSAILHRSFKDNEFAANGTRLGFSVIDEIGFCSNIEAVLGQMAECTTSGGRKYGTIWMTGTGGDMEGGTTLSIQKVFFDPASYDCLEFDDIFEGRPKKIGFFVPAWMALDEFRDELGNVNRELAMKKLMKERAEAEKAKSKKPLNDLMQMKPLYPSEAFLAKSGNIFDGPELTDWISTLETERDGYVEGKAGEIVITEHGIPEFRVNLKKKPCGFPIEEKDDKDGAIVIWKEPSDIVGENQEIPYGMFIAGLDPYAKDESESSVSLGSIQLFVRKSIGGQSFDEQVAEYTARPESTAKFYENCMKLLMYYNALCLYENNFNQFKEYLQNRNKLHYLAKTPTALKNNKADAIASTYGWNTNGSSKDELELYTKDWLYEEAGDGKLNLHHIYSIPLLKELKAYNDDGNFDRVIALMLFVAQSKQMHKIATQKKETQKKSGWATKTFFRR